MSRFTKNSLNRENELKDRSYLSSLDMIRQKSSKKFKRYYRNKSYSIVLAKRLRIMMSMRD